MSTTLKVYIVEDDPWYAELLAYHLSLNPDYEVQQFNTAKDFLAHLHHKPGVVTLDYSLPDMKGDQLLKKVKATYPDVPVVMISGQENVKTAISLLKEGAYDYIVKDDDTKERVWNVIKNIRENLALKQEVEILREEVEKKYTFSHIIKGNSQVMQKTFRLMEKAVKTNITVSITGETGTGKELVAKAIHYSSRQNKKKFVAVNVTAIPKDLVESELFGYEKGAFTGAIGRRIGKFEEAHQGTLFLDEIGELPLNLQAKLLRALQEREITRIGGNETIKIDTRIIVATHKNLLEEVKKGNFREDLYYRLLGLPIQLPPLRARENDILLLAKHFVDEFCKENTLPVKTISPTVQRKLLSYSFPGNVRELKAVMELAVVMSEKDHLQEEDITFHGNTTFEDFLSREDTLKNYEMRIINHYLDKYDNDVLLVAKKLDIGKSTIYRYLKNGHLKAN